MFSAKVMKVKVKMHGYAKAKAKAKSVHMGRPPKLTPHQRREAIARKDAGETLRDIARTFGVSHTTIGNIGASDG